MSARQVDLLLGVAAVVAGATGLLSWAVGTGWVRAVTMVHGVAGLGLIVLAPAKIRGSVRTGLRRRRAGRWASVVLGLLLVATVVLGLLHATGGWSGVGWWSALWTHFLVAFVALPLVLWHVASRPARPRRTDLDRRALLGGATVLGVSGAVYIGVEGVVRATGLAGADRRFTGSHEVASFDPARMPTVQWLDDTAPGRTDRADWVLTVAGRRIEVDRLAGQARPVEADLDCTGGWWSRQAWDAAPLSELLPDLDARSIRVRSATGYSRLFPVGDAADLYLAVGYGGQPLRRGHGAPVRLVAPGRRGYWWVKWVTDVEPDERPWWLQLPFPPT